MGYPFQKSAGLKTGLAFLLAMTLSTCVGGGKHSSFVSGWFSEETRSEAGAPFVAREKRTVVLRVVLKELEEMQPPSGVEGDIFAQIKSALAEELSSVGRGFIPAENGETNRETEVSNYTYRFASKAPTGDANQVDTLRAVKITDTTFELRWAYKNVGDYNQDGIVDVADAAVVAQHMFHTVNPPNDALDEFVNSDELTGKEKSILLSRFLFLKGHLH